MSIILVATLKQIPSANGPRIQTYDKHGLRPTFLISVRADDDDEVDEDTLIQNHYIADFLRCKFADFFNV